MTAAILIHLSVLLGQEGQPDELEALQAALRAALERIDPCVVTIETVGGVRQARIPDRMKSKMTLPERPREKDRDAPRDDGGDGEGDGTPAPEGRTPRFRNEWEKMLAWPGFQKAEGPTTGLIVSSDGYVVTSAWNFESKPSVVTVTTAAGRTYAAELLGTDRAAGLTLLRIEAQDLPVPRFVDPARVRLGSWAFAIGRAIPREGVEVKYGIVSARNRIEGNALQTDAATSPSNYGGPLIDVEGNVYGVIVPLGARGEEANPNWYDSGIGFAAPIPDPQQLIARLGKPGIELHPAFLGVATDQDRTEPGAMVTRVEPDHAAAKSGIRKGDVVTAIDSKPVANAFTLRFEIGRRRAGDAVRLTVRRGDETLEIEATLGARPMPATRREKLPVPMPGMPKDRKKERDG